MDADSRHLCRHYAHHRVVPAVECQSVRNVCRIGDYCGQAAYGLLGCTITTTCSLI